MENKDGYTEAEIDFVASFKALCKRYDVRVSWEPISENDENSKDYFFTSETGDIILPMAAIVYGELNE